MLDLAVDVPTWCFDPSDDSWRLRWILMKVQDCHEMCVSGMDDMIL